MKNNKKSLSYKRVLKEAFLKEASFGGRSTPVQGMGGGHFRGYDVGSKSSRIGNTMTGPTGYDLPEIQRQEREEHKAPNLLPFPLDVSFEHISEIILHMDKLVLQLKIVKDNNTILSEADLEKIQKMYDYVEKTIDNFVKIGKTIENINLGDDFT